MDKIQQIRNEFFGYLIYIQLMSSLNPNPKKNITDRDFNKNIVDLYDNIKTLSDHELKMKQYKLRTLLKKMTNAFTKMFPPKVKIEDIAKVFDQMTHDNPDLYSYGIELGLLESLMDCRRMNFPDGLPFQTKLGLGVHAGSASIEDQFLLRDAFYSLNQALSTFDIIVKYGNYLKNLGKETLSKEEYEEITKIKFNSISYSRLTLISFYSFIEAFVNIRGYDFYYRNKMRLSSEQQEIIQGKKKNSYLSLESKFEKYPTIIRSDKKQVIFVRDEKQRKEPFKTFLGKYKELRDSSVHFSPSKEKIWIKPEEWKDKATEFSKITIDTAMEFWNACYPKINYPEYLDYLDYEKLNKEAIDRIEVEKSIIKKVS